MPSKAHELYCITWIQLCKFMYVLDAMYVCNRLKMPNNESDGTCASGERALSLSFSICLCSRWNIHAFVSNGCNNSHVGLSPLVCTRDFITTVELCNDLLLTGSQNGHQRLRLTGICGCQWPVTTLGMNSKWGQTEALHQDTMEKEGPLGHHVTAARWLQQ